ncbi:hypothetical protein [Streptomyces wuyuanensis]|uniref:hypothetical protein n=1 Tax=Streptomyces wuyuanensis TaxID=1196353 RepID=UPI00341888CC
MNKSGSGNPPPIGEGGAPAGEYSQHLWDTQVRAAIRSLDYMPDRPYRNFAGWMATHARYADRWFQLTNLTAQVRMTHALFSGLFTEDESVRLFDHIALMNVHQSYETFSDNLAFGLATPQERRHLEQDTRRTVVLAFNEAMLSRLGGTDAEEVKAQILALQPRTVSVFRQSLGESEYRELATEYVSAHPDVDPTAIEFDVAPVLLANIEAAFAQVQNMRGRATAEPLRKGLSRRYSAVTRQLTRPPESSRELLSVGIDSVLVVPTVLYCAGVIAELIRPVPGYTIMLTDGTLERAATAAALSVRLLNDCGTRLLEQSREDHASLVAELHQLHASDRSGRFETVSDLVLRAQENDGVLLTRFTKDLLFGEFNVCLDGIRNLPATSASLALLEERLGLVRSAYRDARTAMAQANRLLTQGLGYDVLSVLIDRFVEFQRSTYSHVFDSVLGEFATPRSH